MADSKAVTIRIPNALLAQLKDSYAETYPVHRESFNTFILGLLAGANAQK